MSPVNTYRHGNQYKENHTCIHTQPNVVSDKDQPAPINRTRNIAVALSESLISIAPRVFKDRRVGSGEGT